MQVLHEAQLLEYSTGGSADVHLEAPADFWAQSAQLVEKLRCEGRTARRLLRRNTHVSFTIYACRRLSMMLFQLPIMKANLELYLSDNTGPCRSQLQASEANGVRIALRLYVPM